MSRIDVVKGEKGKFKVMVNQISHGTELSSVALANRIAIQIKSAFYPTAELHLAAEIHISSQSFK
jgi:hypothetical protein